MFVDKIFERATIRGLWDYRLFGLGADEDDRSYEERLDEPYMRFEKAVEKYDRSNTSELLDLCNEVSNETASVCMEIGLQAGILFIVKKVEVGSFNDSFLSEESSQDAKLEKMQEIPLFALYPFKNHPFKGKNDETMLERTDIALVSAIAHPDLESSNKLIAWHKRHRAQ